MTQFLNSIFNINNAMDNMKKLFLLFVVLTHIGRFPFGKKEDPIKQTIISTNGPHCHPYICEIRKAVLKSLWIRKWLRVIQRINVTN